LPLESSDSVELCVLEDICRLVTLFGCELEEEEEFFICRWLCVVKDLVVEEKNKTRTSKYTNRNRRLIGLSLFTSMPGW
jgi:hypothetical protein